MEDGTFDPERCAALHNKILQRAIAAQGTYDPGNCNMRRDLITRMREQIPADASWVLDTDRDMSDDDDGTTEASTPLEQHQIYRFFSQLDSFDPDSLPLTAEFRQPDPLSMSLGDMEDREIILLYPDNLSDAFMDAGLYVELNSFYATTWRLDVSKLPPSDSATWIPLEVILTKMLEMWDLDKLQWDANKSTVGFMPWVGRDLEDALRAWDNLLAVIVERMPGSSRPASPSEPMLAADLVKCYEVSPFSRAFLSRAPRPGFQFVAPGLTTFTPDTFTALMDLEDDTSPRRRFNAEAPEGSDIFSSLLLPSASSTVPTMPEDPIFDRDWGVGKFTIGRRPGLYTDPLQGDQFADGTLLITDRGVANPWSFENRRPWGVARAVRLAEMLEAWADCVRNGAWDVSEEGVATPNGWFTARETKEERTLSWLMHSR